MSFNSTEFVFFFLAAFYGYWSLARWRRSRLTWLLAASCVFYMSWNAKFLGLIAFSSVLDYVCGARIHASRSPRVRQAWLFVSLAGNLGLLGFFKYFNFFADNVAAGLARAGFTSLAEFTPWEIVLPAGISFYTFQTLSYTIDIYRGQLAPARSFLDFALFVSFFPQLVAGPIVRASEFLPQLEATPAYDDGRVSRGVFLMLCGLAKKVLLADTIGLELVDPVFRDPGAHGAFGVLVGVWGALFQFYLDFSAYSDIAIGAAATLGFTLPLNFDRPFLAQSISEFWRRWHISLSTWFRDYVFLPLGGRGGGRLQFFKKLMLTMFLTGLWHGAGWNYVLWGLMHGVFTFVGVAFRAPRDLGAAKRELWERVLRRVWVFHLVALSMLFFRNGSVLEGARGIEGSLEMLRILGSDWITPANLSSVGLAALAVAALIHYTPREWIHERGARLWSRAPALAQALVLALATGVLAALSYAKSPFLYYQF